MAWVYTDKTHIALNEAIILASFNSPNILAHIESFDHFTHEGKQQFIMITERCPSKFFYHNSADGTLNYFAQVNGDKEQNLPAYLSMIHCILRAGLPLGRSDS